MGDRIVRPFGIPVFQSLRGCWAVRYAKRRWLWHHRADCELRHL